MRCLCLLNLLPLLSALVWGTSVKHNPQKVGKEHVLCDEDVVQLVKKSVLWVWVWSPYQPPPSLSSLESRLHPVVVIVNHPLNFQCNLYN